ncbi:hypothetical protein AYI68_g4573 [Smittium mucronatum]|uniref:Ubiquitin-like domain-containing protein n=1 Tax=Smittium mucronatum TaxID=133383 RepID=A0A1R0GWP6_9FUNG|nr:hypothetical protein AYI68_g4573 [Smittium mucronatum]
MDITIRFTDNESDLNLVLPPDTTVFELRKKIKRERPNLESSFLRFIKAGRILHDSQTLGQSFTETLNETPENEGTRFIHCLVSDIEAVEGQEPMVGLFLDKSSSLKLNGI